MPIRDCPPLGDELWNSLRASENVKLAGQNKCVSNIDTLKLWSDAAKMLGYMRPGEDFKPLPRNPAKAKNKRVKWRKGEKQEFAELAEMVETLKKSGKYVKKTKIVPTPSQEQIPPKADLNEKSSSLNQNQPKKNDVESDTWEPERFATEDSPKSDVEEISESEEDDTAGFRRFLNQQNLKQDQPFFSPRSDTQEPETEGFSDTESEPRVDANDFLSTRSEGEESEDDTAGFRRFLNQQNLKQDQPFFSPRSDTQEPETEGFSDTESEPRVDANDFLSTRSEGEESEDDTAAITPHILLQSEGEETDSESISDDEYTISHTVEDGEIVPNYAGIFEKKGDVIKAIDSILKKDEKLSEPYITLELYYNLLNSYVEKKDIEKILNVAINIYKVILPKIKDDEKKMLKETLRKLINKILSFPEFEEYSDELDQDRRFFLDTMDTYDTSYKGDVSGYESGVDSAPKPQSEEGYESSSDESSSDESAPQDEFGGFKLPTQQEDVSQGYESGVDSAPKPQSDESSSDESDDVTGYVDSAPKLNVDESQLIIFRDLIASKFINSYALHLEQKGDDFTPFLNSFLPEPIQDESLTILIDTAAEVVDNDNYSKELKQLAENVLVFIAKKYEEDDEIKTFVEKMEDQDSVKRHLSDLNEPYPNLQKDIAEEFPFYEIRFAKKKTCSQFVPGQYSKEKMYHKKHPLFAKKTYFDVCEKANCQNKQQPNKYGNEVYKCVDK